MTVLIVLIAAALGGVLGGALGFFLVIGLGLLTGADTQQGALAMGAATTGLPLGVVAGLLAGGWLGLRLRRRSAPGAGHAWQGRAALALVAALAAGVWAWFTWTGEPPLIRDEAGRPLLLVEIRVPADDPDIAHALARGTDLRHGEIFHSADTAMERLDQGEHAVLSTGHQIRYRTADRSVTLWLGPERLLVFDLDLPAMPEQTDRFTDWRPADSLRRGYDGAPYPPEEAETYHIRTRVVVPGG